VERHQIIEGSDEEGNLYSLTVRDISKENLILHVEKRGKVMKWGTDITLFQCLPKGKRFDTILRQCVETGVTRIVPVISENTVVSLSDEKRIEKMRRWEKIGKEALQQSGRIQSILLSPVTDIEQTSASFNEFDLKLFFHEQPLAHKGLHQYLFEERKHIALFIGPEGGFSKKEVRFLESSGFLPVWLGDRVLRVDTAALFAISSIQILLLERELWKSR
jgi:16S rRNA (uracil1498-N3)-methyltransferase